MGTEISDRTKIEQKLDSSIEQELDSSIEQELDSPYPDRDFVESCRARPPEHYRRSQMSGRERRVYSWSRRSKLLLVVVVVVILVDFFTALLLGTQLYKLDDENQTLRIALARNEGELRQVVPELERLRADLDELIRGKLPRLRKLEYDRVLPLDESCLKNVIFTEVVSRDIRGYEYKLVVQNNTQGPLWPEIRIYLFNELGIQVGSAEIGTRSPSALKSSSLGVGEVRSYSGLIELADKSEKPAYFLVQVPEETGSQPKTARPGTDGKL